MTHGHDDGLPEEHEEHANHEAWVIPYADLLTLLMAMFIALFAMSTVDMSKFKALAIGFNEALNGPSLDSGVFSKTAGNSPLNAGGAGLNPDLNGGAVGVGAQADTNSVLKGLATQRVDMQAARSAEQQQLKQVEHKIQAAANQLGLGGKLHLQLEQDGLVVTVVTDKILFDSGSADLQAGGKQLLDLIAGPLRSVTNPILIKGYTDARPIANSFFPSNWQLSGARAGAVAEYFSGVGITDTRLRPQGMGDLDPVASNATPEGQAANRRVQIVVQSNLVARALQDAGLTDNKVSNKKPAAVEAPVTDPVNPDVSPNFTSH